MWTTGIRTAAALVLCRVAIATAAMSSSAALLPTSPTPVVEPFADALQSGVVNGLNASDAPFISGELPTDLGIAAIDEGGVLTDAGEIWTTDIDGSPMFGPTRLPWLPDTTLTTLAAESDFSIPHVFEMPPIATAATPPAVPLPPAFGVGIATFALSVFAWKRKRQH